MWYGILRSKSIFKEKEYKEMIMVNSQRFIKLFLVIWKYIPKHLFDLLME